MMKAKDDDEDKASNESDEDEDEEDDEFQPSDDDEEAEERPSVRRRSTAPSRSSGGGGGAVTSAAAAAAPRRAPSRARSAAAAAATSSAAAAAAGGDKKRSSALKRKKPVASSSEEDSTEAEESEEEDENDGDQVFSSSSDDDDEEQSSALRKKRRSNAGGAAAAAAANGRKGSKGKDKDDAKGKRRRNSGRGHVDKDGTKQSDFAGDDSLLARFHRLRSLYEAPSGFVFEAAFGADADTDAAMSDTDEAPAAAAAAAAAAAEPPSPFVDFTLPLPHSVSQHVMSFLSPATVARSERVCRRWHSVASSPAVWKQLMQIFFPLLVRAKDAALRRQDSDVDVLASLRPREAEEEQFFKTARPEFTTKWTHRFSDSNGVPIFDPLQSAPLGTLPSPKQSMDDLLQAERGVFHWKHTLVNRLASTCVECRAPCVSVYRLTDTRVCIPCAMQHGQGLYDVVNSGCAKGKSMLTDRDLAPLPSVTEWAPDDHKTVFFNHFMVKALRHAKYGGESGFQRAWDTKVQAAHVRLKQKQEQGLTKKKRIPIVYRDNVGSTAEKTKGFFLSVNKKRNGLQWGSCLALIDSSSTLCVCLFVCIVALVQLRSPQPCHAVRQASSAAHLRRCVARMNEGGGIT
jgi:hypothetical protein